MKGRGTKGNRKLSGVTCAPPFFLFFFFFFPLGRDTYTCTRSTSLLTITHPPGVVPAIKDCGFNPAPACSRNFEEPMRFYDDGSIVSPHNTCRDVEVKVNVVRGRIPETCPPHFKNGSSVFSALCHSVRHSLLQPR